jgi:hypothetical protein
MRTAADSLLSFFWQVTIRDPTLITALTQETAFSIDDKRWEFDLQQLHRFLQLYDSGFSDIEYRRFRQLLYRCPVNRKIKPGGAEIIIVDNQSNVDASTYALVWNDTRNEKDFHHDPS